MNSLSRLEAPRSDNATGNERLRRVRTGFGETWRSSGVIQGCELKSEEHESIGVSSFYQRV